MKPTPQHVLTDNGPLNKPKKTSDNKVVKMNDKNDHGIIWQPVKDLCETEKFGDHYPIFDASRDDNLTAMASHLGNNIQFPKSTAFMHGLGCIAAACVYNFSVKKYGHPMPVNLYMMTSQPPSTGKSSINREFTTAIHTAFSDLNKKNERKRKKLQSQLDDLFKQFKSNESEEIARDIHKTQEKIEKLANIVYCPTNATPEKLEEIAFKQGARWSAMSDESGLINSLLGKTYGESTGTSNQDIILQGWDGDYMNSSRITRDGGSGFVRGSLSVIAQDEQVITMFEAGARGTGLSQRFLVYREPDMLGKRDHEKSFDEMPVNLSMWYTQLISIIVNSGPVEFTLCKKSEKLIRDQKIEIEPQLGDGGEYDHDMMRGFLGKLDKHVTKIAAVLHIVMHWSETNRPTVISVDAVEWAIEIFNKLAAMYVSVADRQGFSGEQTDQDAVIKCLKAKLERAGALAVRKGVSVSNRMLRDSVKGLKAFKGRPNIGKHLSDKIIPLLKERNILVEIKKGHYIVNPNLSD